jgi:hypothetical protein
MSIFIQFVGWGKILVGIDQTFTLGVFASFQHFLLQLTSCIRATRRRFVNQLILYFLCCDNLL